MFKIFHSLQMERHLLGATGRFKKMKEVQKKNESKKKERKIKIESKKRTEVRRKKER